MNELSPIAEKIAAFYDANYRLVNCNLVLKPTDKCRLGNRTERECRFCGKTSPEVPFTQETHALPEAMGNKSLITYYECDVCNQKFGRGIDNEFGKWSKPIRTFYQIGGKDGVPILKREGPTAWRIELKHDGFIFQQRVDSPVVQLDEKAEQLSVEVPIDRHVPVAVFKAYVKMALSLLPDSEVPCFAETFRWLQEDAHTRPFHADIARVYYTFTPGPRPFEGVTTFLFVKKESAPPLPYCTFVVAFGNECHQLFVPCPSKDRVLQDKQISLPLLPTPYQSKDMGFGPSTGPAVYDLAAAEPVRGSIKRIFHAQVVPKN